MPCFDLAIRCSRMHPDAMSAFQLLCMSLLSQDPDFREFLTADGDLPRSTNTGAMSGAGVMRLFSKVSDSLNKMTFKMDETDQVYIYDTLEFC